MQIQPYLNFAGRTEEALKFYKECLGGSISAMTFAASPMEGQVPPEWRSKIMHASLAVDDQVVMASDGPPGAPAEGMKGFSLAITVQSAQEAEKVFNALSKGGQVRMPLQETFWASRFGMLVDRYGVSWMVNLEKPH